MVVIGGDFMRNKNVDNWYDKITINADTKLDRHIEDKLKILKQLGINLSYDEKENLRERSTITSVDSYARALINRRWSA